MLILYDFQCDSCGMKMEQLVSSDVHSIPCDCGHELSRVISPVRIDLPGWDPAYPTAASKWERAHEKAAKKEPRDFDDGIQ